MQKNKLFYVSIALFFYAINHTHAQKLSSFLQENSNFKMDLEYRPRTEYRRGYRTLPNNSDDGAFFTSHRARINVDFNLNNRFLFHTTLQDIRVWGDTDTRESEGKAQFFEFYVQPKITNHLSVRVGRQRIIFDNQRLFAENNWRQAGGQHDAVRFLYNNNKLVSDVVLAYNQDNASEFGTTYDVDWDFYRGMIAHHLKYQLSEDTELLTLNFADEYTDPSTNNKKGYWKMTNGGRLTYNVGAIGLTFSGYYQWGKIENGKDHSAYYLEPEVQWYANPKYKVRIGTQVFSGDGNANDEKSTAFLSQYGAFHRHNGGLDYTQKTVRTYEHEGILNPYLFQYFSFNDKFSLQWQSHLLGSTSSLAVDQKKYNRIYAWENDFRFFYQPNDYTKIELSYLFLVPDKGMAAIPTGVNGNTDQLAQFAYASIRWTPEILNFSH
ncbi:alginate export family protein [Ochrovirga pacifica]|uniref:alginate export family protein n=1 Tax=Ochrovirga pacifica TaxID=1042376 RepID=UPI000255A833|nr:alginate export family protein [Ochrovirga pacifica]